MPTPVSATEISTIPSFIAARTSIRPPSGVNLRALESRFKSTCFTFRSSPRTAPTRSSIALPSEPVGLLDRRLPRNSPYIAADNGRQGEWNLDRALPRRRENLPECKDVQPGFLYLGGGSRAGVAGRLDLEGGVSCPELHALTSKPRRAPAAERTC